MEYVSQDQKRQLLDVAMVNGEFTLASGKKSDTKFDFDRISTESKLYEVALHSLAACIKNTLDGDDYDSLAVVTVATGANRLGDQLAEGLAMYHVPSRKDLDGNFYIPERTEGLVGVLVDDVYTSGSSFEKVKREFKGRIIAAYALLDRSGSEHPTLHDGTVVHSVMRHHIQ